MRETRRLVVAISLSGSAVSFSLTGTQRGRGKRSTQAQENTLFHRRRPAQVCNYSALWSDPGFGSPSSSVSAGGVGTSAASPSKPTRNRSERREEPGQELPRRSLPRVPRLRPHFYSHFSNFRRPGHRDLVGHCGGEPHQRGDVEGSARSLLFHAILGRRYVTLQHRKFVPHRWRKVGALTARVYGTYRQRKKLPVDLYAKTIGVVVLLRATCL